MKNLLGRIAGVLAWLCARQPERTGGAMSSWTGPIDEQAIARVEGEVLAQFVVDTMGMYEGGTFKVLSSSHESFSQAVREAVPQMRFTPAEVGGASGRHEGAAVGAAALCVFAAARQVGNCVMREIS